MSKAKHHVGQAFQPDKAEPKDVGLESQDAVRLVSLTYAARRQFMVGSLRYAVAAGLSMVTIGLWGRSRGSTADRRACRACPERGDCKLQIENCRLKIGKR